MKILLITYQFGGTASGIMSYRVASELVRRGHNVVVVTEHNHLNIEQWDVNNCIEVSHWFSKTSLYYKLLWHLSKRYRLTGRDFLWGIRAFIKANRFVRNWYPDWIYCRSSPIDANIIGNFFSKRGYDVLQHFADPFPSPMSFYRDKECREYVKASVIPVLQSASLISMGNDAMMKYQMRETGIDFSAKSFVSPDPAPYDNISFLSERSSKNSEKCFTYLGEIYASRNPMNLFDAIYNLNQNGLSCHLNIYSDFSKDLPEKYKQFISYKGRTKNVKDVIVHSDLLVDLDGDEEIPVYMSSKLKDYLCSNIPVLSITPKNSPSNCLLKDLKTIRTVQNNVEEIQSAMEWLIKEPFVEKDYGERNLLLYPFTKKHIVNDIISHFNEFKGEQ